MISPSSTIIVPSLVLLPRSAQFGKVFASYGWTMLVSFRQELICDLAQASTPKKPIKLTFDNVVLADLTFDGEGTTSKLFTAR